MIVEKKEQGLLAGKLKDLRMDHFDTLIDCSFVFDLSKMKEWTNPEYLIDEQYGKVILSFELSNKDNSLILTEDSITVSQKDFLYKTIFVYLKEFYEKELKFMQHHFTGFIGNEAYKTYLINYKISAYPKLLKSFVDKAGETIELRQDGSINKYVKKDENDEICRDNQGLALYLSDEEVLKRGLPLYSTTIVAFNSSQESVGLASDEFGADGIWVNPNYQNRGIGLALLTTFRTQFSEDRQMGQMTEAGMHLARMYYRNNILKLK